MFSFSTRFLNNFQAQSLRLCKLSTSVTCKNLIRISNENGVKNIVLANPKTRNALSLSLMEELHDAIIQKDSDLRCIVLSAEGKVFSAGHNLKELTAEDGRAYHKKVFEKCSNLMLSINSIDVPVIAKVNGVAAAAGCQLVASCDIVVASDHSTFSTPGANVGIFCSTPGVPLVRNVPRKVSANMLLSGLPINAQQALQSGLVSTIVPEADLDKTTNEIVKAILNKSKSVIALGKKFMYQQMEMGIKDAYSVGADIMVNNINMKDGQEGINCFIKKKKPQWSHSDE